MAEKGEQKTELHVSWDGFEFGLQGDLDVESFVLTNEEIGMAAFAVEISRL